MITYYRSNLHPDFYWVEIDRENRHAIIDNYIYYLTIPSPPPSLTLRFLVHRFNRNNHNPFMGFPVLQSNTEFPWCADATNAARSYIQTLLGIPFEPKKAASVKQRADLPPSPIPAMLTKLAPKIANTYLKKLSGEK